MKTNGAFKSANDRVAIRKSVRGAREERLRYKSAFLAEKKAKQREKIKEFRVALFAAGCTALDEQAEVLGLSRSTTWSILKADHKSSGLSAAILNRMWASPRLPQPVQIKILEYVEEKNAGLYGDTPVKCRKFRARLQKDLVKRSGDLR